jgi:predicted hydrolase (HD superfamily)
MKINLKLSSLNLFKERTEMCDLARECGTDKEQHGYTKVYHDIMIDNKYVTPKLFRIVNDSNFNIKDKSS